MELISKTSFKIKQKQREGDDEEEREEEKEKKRRKTKEKQCSVLTPLLVMDVIELDFVSSML